MNLNVGGLLTLATFLVTGGAGFIGSHIVDELVKRGESVRVLDNLSTGKMENLSASLGSIEFVRGDVRDESFVANMLKGVNFVLHQAALPSVPRSIRDPMSTHSVNVDGTLNLLLASRDAGVERVVYASSSSVYGDTPTLPKTEDMEPKPLSPYAVSKLASELYCKVFSGIYGLQTVGLRYFNVFGPRQDPLSEYAAVIPKFIECALRRDSVDVRGDGEQSRDFTYVANVVEANLLACSAPGVTGVVMNIACGNRATVNELCQTIGALVGAELVVNHSEARPGEVRHSMAGIGLANTLIGYSPRVQLEEGLRRTVRWYRESRGQKAPTSREGAV